MQYEFKVARSRVLAVFLGSSVLVVGAVAVTIEADAESIGANADSIGFIGACIAACVGFLIPKQLALLFAKNPIMTVDKSCVFHKMIMVEPIPWSRIDGIVVPAVEEPQHLELIVEGLKSSERRGHRYFGRVLRRDSYLPESFNIPVTVLQGTMIDVLRAFADNGGIVGLRALAHYLSGSGKKYAQKEEVENLLDRLESKVRSAEEAIELAWTLRGGGVPYNASRLERAFDIAIKQDAEYVRDKVELAAGFDFVFQDIGRKRLAAGGYDVSDIPEPNQSQVKIAEENSLLGPLPVAVSTRVIGAVKAAFFLSMATAALVAMFSGAFDVTEEWTETAIAAAFAGLMLWAFSLDLKVALGVARRGTSRR